MEEDKLVRVGEWSTAKKVKEKKETRLLYRRGPTCPAAPATAATHPVTSVNEEAPATSWPHQHDLNRCGSTSRHCTELPAAPADP
ncbi:hypothetical protein NL676_029802 [Syzygium grande]|nr:hypothetical protein NL676_029802 [Syzygium grande]